MGYKQRSSGLPFKEMGSSPADYKESPAKKIDPTLANKTSKESDAPKQKGKFHTYETKQYDKEGNERTGDNKEAEEFTHKSQFDESGREFSTTEPGGVADTVYWNKPKK